MTKGDIYTKEIFNRIKSEGRLDKDPRPHYKDGTPAHTLSVNHGMCTYDISKGESPLITLRPVAIKSAVGELLWIYRDQSNDLDVLRDKYNVTWWDEWDIGDRTIGHSYGGTVWEHNLMTQFHDEMRNHPDSRRHQINLWQNDDFLKKHGLKPCAFLTMWNVRHEEDADYLDMMLVQRSSDFAVAGCINQMQYLVFLHCMAKKYNYKPGRFTWVYDNIQIYDRHYEQVDELLSREPVECNPTIEIDEHVTWENMMPENVHVKNYPTEEIKKKNKQLKFELAI